MNGAGGSHPFFLDAFVELANIGAGSAAGALSQLLGDRPVRIEVPQARWLAVAELSRLWQDRLEQVARLVFVSVEGDLPGQLFLLVPTGFQDAVVALLPAELAEAARAEPESLMAEFGNILLTAYLNAVAEFTARRLSPGVPVVLEDMLGAVLVSALAIHPDSPGEVILLETRFLINGRSLTGYILHLPEREPFARILAELGVAP